MNKKLFIVGTLISFICIAIGSLLAACFYAGGILAGLWFGMALAKDYYDEKDP